MIARVCVCLVVWCLCVRVRVLGMRDCEYTGSLLTYYLNGLNGPCWPGFLPFVVAPEVTEGSLLSGFTSDRYMSGDEVATYIEVGGAYTPGANLIGSLGPSRLLLVETIHIDVSYKASTNPNYEVTMQDIDEWICENGPIPPRSFVIFNTGWSFKRGTRYYGPQTIMDQDILANTIDQDVLGLLPLLVPELFGFTWPGLSDKAAEYLLDCFPVIGVGIDTPSVDAGFHYKPYATDLPDSRGVRRFLTSYGVFVVHNLLLIDAVLPPRGLVTTLGVFNMACATRAPVTVYTEHCADPRPAVCCEASDYRHIVLGNYQYRRR